jgi:hypothetical protein
MGLVHGDASYVGVTAPINPVPARGLVQPSRSAIPLDGAHVPEDPTSAPTRCSHHQVMAQPERVRSVPARPNTNPTGIEMEQDAVGSVGSQAEEGRPC